jgi:1-acyl-sn-glycerol-3-phosphate acyltransferase
MRDALRSVIIIPLICCAAMVIGTLALLLSLVDQRGQLQAWCGRTWCRVVATLAGLEVRVSGVENIPRDRPCVFAVNHQSFLDIPALYAAVPVRLLFVARRSLFSIPFLGWFLWRAGHIPIDQEKARVALANLNRAVAKLHDGVAIVIFPEGTRSVDGALLAFKSGGFKLALKAGVPIVPVTISGTHRVLRRDALVFHPGEVEIMIDPPLETDGYTSRTLPELIARTRACIAAHLEPGAKSSATQLPHTN